jgi:sugar (pentulose or hexulose) kinase
MKYFLGIDFGTSGARGIVIDQNEKIQYQQSLSYSIENIESWKLTLEKILKELPQCFKKELSSIAIDGTSSTVLLCDLKGKPLDSPILYNDNRGSQEIPLLEAIITEPHLVKSSTSSLVKLLWWSHQKYITDAVCFLHQADWLGFLLHGKLGISDYNNSLKLGYDAENLCYPIWLKNLPIAHLLPTVVYPGTPIANITNEISSKYDISGDCLVVAGTTDSIAAFLASGVHQVGDAVSSLGSTLVLKLLGQKNINNSNYGIYSHRLGDYWLTGGASNSGGAVLKEFFSIEQINNLSRQIDPNTESGLDYYPLLKIGERFPINDPFFAPRLTPQPESPAYFLHGLLEGIAKIEAKGYKLLESLGSTTANRVYTAGGGAKNLIWLQMRERLLGIPVLISPQTEAAYGAALLAKNGFLKFLAP